MKHWIIFLNGIRPVSGHIFPRQTQSAPPIIINLTFDTGDLSDDEAMTAGTYDLLKVLFDHDRQEQTIIPSVVVQYD